MRPIVNSLCFLCILLTPHFLSKPHIVWRHDPIRLPTWNDHRRILNDLSKDPYLKTLAFLESSSGKLLNHRKISRGSHKGTSAVGFWGMMPLTIKDMVIRYKPLKSKYSHLINANTDLKEISSIVLANPDLHKDAVLFYKKLVFKSTDCPKRRVYAWKYGIEGALNASIETIMKDPYVVNFFTIQDINNLNGP